MNTNSTPNPEFARILDKFVDAFAELADYYRGSVDTSTAPGVPHLVDYPSPLERRAQHNADLLRSMQDRGVRYWKIATLMLRMLDAQGRRKVISRKKYGEIAATILDPQTGQSYNPGQGTNHGYVGGLQPELHDSEQERWVSDKGIESLRDWGFLVESEWADNNPPRTYNPS